MKKILMVTLLVCLFASAYAQKKDTVFVKAPEKHAWTVEAYALCIENQYTPTVDAYFRHGLGDRWALSVFSLITPTWGELYGGIEFAPIKELWLGVSAGMETGDSISASWRLAGSCNVYTDHFKLQSCVEYGGTGFWYNVYPYGVFAKGHLGAGIMLRKFHGLGPRLDVSILNSHLNFWGAGLWYQGEWMGATSTRQFGWAAGVSLAF